MIQTSLASTLPELIQCAVDTYGDKVAIKESVAGADIHISYTQLNQQRWQAAKAFYAMGLVKGDRVAIWAPNISEWIIACIGLQTIGAVLVPINTRMKGAEAADLMRRSGARMLLTLAEFECALKSKIYYLDMLVDEDLPALQTKVCLRGEAQSALSWQAFLAKGGGVAQSTVEALSHAVSADDMMDVLFTSGTTGQAKGVMCAHGQNIRTVSTWADINGLNDQDNYLIINPFFHSFGYKAGWLAALIKGAKILPVLVFDLDAVLQQIEDDHVSVLPGPPTIYQSLLAHPKRGDYNLSSLRLAVTGAAPVPVALINQMRDELQFGSVMTAYGLTETCGFVSISRADDPAEIISTSSGKVMQGIEVKCVDSDGNEVAHGEPGEIWVRGYNVMQGYLDNEQATKDAITDDAWLKTGDIGTIDKNGYIDITDRIKDMYISGGFNVYPAEIEKNIAAITGVIQVAVIGVSDQRMGEVGKVFIVKQPQADISQASVIDWCKQHMANYKVPKLVEFIDAMPLNATGKIVKTALRIKTI